MKILKNRLVIGCVCIILAFAVGFIGVPKITEMLNEKIAVVVAAQNIPKGTELTESMFRSIRMSKGDLPYAEGEYYNFRTSAEVPSNMTANIRSLFTEQGGKYYAATEICANDILTAAKVSSTNVYKDEKLRELGENQYAVAVSVNTIAEGIAAKVMAGDIVMLLIYDKNTNIEKVDPFLMYVEVLNVTNSEAVEINDSQTGASSGIPSVVTFKANIDQAIYLAKYENTANIHLALVCRGDEEKKAELLKKQNEFLSANTIVNREEYQTFRSMLSSSGQQKPQEEEAAQ